MPKIGMEPSRRKALISAAISMIGESGSTDVTVKQIATRAGMSSALAFHYFGDKDEIIFETMRHILREFSSGTAARLRSSRTPVERLENIISSSFEAGQFSRTVIAAWLVFYLRAFSSERSAKLLSIYTARLRSNLLHDLKKLCDPQKAVRIEQGLSAMIDGLYIRQGLRPQGPAASEAIKICLDYLHLNLSNQEA